MFVNTLLLTKKPYCKLLMVNSRVFGRQSARNEMTLSSLKRKKKNMWQCFGIRCWGMFPWYELFDRWGYPSSCNISQLGDSKDKGCQPDQRSFWSVWGFLQKTWNVHHHEKHDGGSWKTTWTIWGRWISLRNIHSNRVHSWVIHEISHWSE